MSFNTALLDFSVDPKVITTPELCQALHHHVEEILSVVVPGMTRLIEDLTPSGGFLLNYNSIDGDTFVTLRGHPSGLVSLQIENFGDAFIMDDKDVMSLEATVRHSIGAQRSKAILPLRRGRAIDPFFYTSDGRLVEYAVLEMLFDEVTPYQHVQIARTRDFGNMLVLDRYLNLSEKDLIYTESLMAADNYEDKTVLILGGGDGGLLCELLKHKPKFVTMIDIDDVVMTQCRKHLRSVCGTCLDKYEAPNYKIIVGDAFQFLMDSVETGVQFDYVFYDLSDIPVSPDRDQDVWRMVHRVMRDSLTILSPGGKYMTHVTGVNCPAAIQEFERVVDGMPMKTTRTKTTAFVPSFMESWVFYQISIC